MPGGQNSPAGHRRVTDATAADVVAGAGQNAPAGQVVQAAADGGAYVPAGHIGGSTVPAPHAYPGGHGAHSGHPVPARAGADEFVTLAYDPGQHGVGATAGDGQKCPTGQAVHSPGAVRFVAEEYVPPGHGLAVALEDPVGHQWPRAHAPDGSCGLPRDPRPPAQKAPAGHARHCAVAVRLVSGDHVPGGHGNCVGKPVPTGHTWPGAQVTGGTAAPPVPAGHATPAGHSVQPPACVRLSASVNVPAGHGKENTAAVPAGQ
jgi:hypothetical protein